MFAFSRLFEARSQLEVQGRMTVRCEWVSHTASIFALHAEIKGLDNPLLEVWHSFPVLTASENARFCGGAQNKRCCQEKSADGRVHYADGGNGDLVRNWSREVQRLFLCASDVSSSLLSAKRQTFQY